MAYLKETPYWATASKPDFQTSVTSQEVVAWSLQDRKAEMALLPTTQTRVRQRSAGCIFGSEGKLLENQAGDMMRDSQRTGRRGQTSRSKDGARSTHLIKCASAAEEPW